MSYVIVVTCMGMGMNLDVTMGGGVDVTMGVNMGIGIKTAGFASGASLWRVQHHGKIEPPAALSTLHQSSDS